MDYFAFIYRDRHIQHYLYGNCVLYPFDQYHKIKYDKEERADRCAGKLELKLLYKEYDGNFRYDVLQRYKEHGSYE